MNEAWQENWDAFLELLSLCVRAKDIEAALAKNFFQKEVRWTGRLDDKNIDPPPPMVEITFGEKTIDFGNGRSTTIDGISLALARENVSAWRPISLGSQVTFTAWFGAGGSPFSPISVKHLKTGESVILIGLSNGKLTSSPQ
jgi:hypothetical protein